MDSSIRKRIVDLLLGRLAGDDETPLPIELGAVKLSKNRNIPIGADELPMYSVYFLNDAPTPVGDPRRPVLTSRKLLIEVRVIVKGNDDAADPHCVWITSRLAGADRCIDQEGQQLAMSVTEGETPFEPLEGAQFENVTTKIRFVVEYNTHPVDITRTS